MSLYSSRYITCVVFLLCLLSGRTTFAQDSPGNTAFNLENYAGKVVYVDFWASWCGPCRASFPFMAGMAHQFGNDLAIVAINVDENRSDALQFLEDFEVTFEIVYDPQGDLAEGFSIPGMPTSYLFDRDGKLLFRHVGFRKSASKELQQAIAQAVNTTRMASQ